MAYLDISIEYGDQTLSKFIPEDRGTVRVIDSPIVQSEISDLKTDLIHALENPINASPLKELVADHYPGCGKTGA